MLQLWQDTSRCSEPELERLAARLGSELKRGDWVILEGPLGAGKSTFARALLQALRAHQPAEGSPTFAIAHEYESPKGQLAHVDLYRLKNELEIDEAGIPSYLWERDMIVFIEWLSLHPGFEKSVFEAQASHRIWLVSLSFPKDGSTQETNKRDVSIKTSA